MILSALFHSSFSLLILFTFFCSWQLVTRCLLFYYSLTVICMQYITWCMLFAIPKLAAHTCRSLIALRKPWIYARCSISITLFSQPPPLIAAKCLISALRCSLLAWNRYLLAAHALILNAPSSLKEVCCIPLAYQFSQLGSCFALLTVCCQVLLSGSMLLTVFSFLITV